MKKRVCIAVSVTGAAILIGLMVAHWFGHWSYAEVSQSIETCVEVAILLFVVIEGLEALERVSKASEHVDKVSKVVGRVYDRTVTETDGFKNDLEVGDRVHVLMPQAGKPSEKWPYSSDIWVIREIDKEKNRATATPVLPPLSGQMPTVTGPLNGPFSPFVGANNPG